MARSQPGQLVIPRDVGERETAQTEIPATRAGNDAGRGQLASDQFAARANNLKRTCLRFAPDEIEHRVGVLDLIFEASPCLHRGPSAGAASVVDRFDLGTAASPAVGYSALMEADA